MKLTDNRDPWSHFNDAFASIDRGFQAVDWRQFDDVKHTQTESKADPLMRKVHTLTASTWRSRRRMARLFLWLAWRILTRGKATIKF